MIANAADLDDSRGDCHLLCSRSSYADDGGQHRELRTLPVIFVSSSPGLCVPPLLPGVLKAWFPLSRRASAP